MVKNYFKVFISIILLIITFVLILSCPPLGNDNVAKMIYWTDAGTDKIQWANMDGSGVEDLVTGLNSPCCIALDL